MFIKIHKQLEQKDFQQQIIELLIVLEQETYKLYGGPFSFARHPGYIVKPGTYSANFNVMITF